MGLATDGTGNLYVSASLYNSTDFGSGSVSSAGGADLVVAKLDPASGNATWTKPFGDAQDQIAGGVAVSHSGQVAAIGTFTGSITAGNTITNSDSNAIDFILALDNNAGTALWAKPVNTKFGTLLAIGGNPARDEFVVCGYTAPCTDPNNPACTGAMTDLGVAGYVNSETDPGTSLPVYLEDIFIAKLNSATGAVVWAKQLGGAGSQVCSAVTMDSSGNVFATGYYNGTLGFGTGMPSFTDYTILALWVAKFDTATGAAITAKSYGGFSKQFPKGIAVDSSGNVAMTGNMKASLVFGPKTLTSAGSTDGFLAKLDSSLDPLWANRWGDAAAQEGHAVAFQSNGDIVVVGQMRGTAIFGSTTLVTTGTGSTDAYWARFTSDGSSIGCAAMRYGDVLSQSADSLIISNSGALYMAGFSKGTIDFGNGKSLTSVDSNGFVVQIGP